MSLIITDLSAFLRTLKDGGRWAICLWLLVGFVCLGFDRELQIVLREWGQTPAVARAAKLWSEIGAMWGITAFLITGVIATVRNRDSSILEFVASISLAGLTAQTLKHVVGRARPDAVTSETQFFGPLAWFRVEDGIRIDSFPSGHTAAAFAMAMTLSLRWQRGTQLWFALACGVGASRILTNSHYTSDVVFGALLGTLVASGTNKFLAQDNVSREIPATANETNHESNFIACHSLNDILPGKN